MKIYATRTEQPAFCLLTPVAMQMYICPPCTTQLNTSDMASAPTTHSPPLDRVSDSLQGDPPPLYSVTKVEQNNKFFTARLSETESGEASVIKRFVCVGRYYPNTLTMYCARVISCSVRSLHPPH